MTVPHHDLQRLLTAPILPTLLRLAAPNVMAMVMTVLVGIAETYYVGRLGTAPLAAMALVFPFAMLTQMMSAGAMGGGVSAAISRALGASDLPRAHTLLLHALVIGLGAGVLYSAIFLIWGPFFMPCWAAKAKCSQKPCATARSCLQALCWSGSSTRWRPLFGARAICVRRLWHWWPQRFCKSHWAACLR